MIDAHCHLDFPQLDADRDAVLERARSLGVRGFVVAGYGPDQWDRQQRTADAFDDVHAFFGVHPRVAAQMDERTLDEAMSALGVRATFAIGETGLDRTRHVPRGSMPAQTRAFRAQLGLARDLDLPVVLHVVGAHGKTLELLRRDGVPRSGGMMHSYGGPGDLVGAFEALGLYTSFSGSITRPGACRWVEAARAARPDRLLVETDCPDQVPHGVEGTRSLPEHLPRILAALAAVRGDDFETLAAQTARNARRLFAPLRARATEV